jgi:hypothetical protein
MQSMASREQCGRRICINSLHHATFELTRNRRSSDPAPPGKELPAGWSSFPRGRSATGLCWYDGEHQALLRQPSTDIVLIESRALGLEWQQRDLRDAPRFTA